MTEKQFKARVIDNENAYIEIDGIQCYIDPSNVYDVESKLNKLNDKNEQLKQFKQSVFDLIDKKIEAHKDDISKYGSCYGAYLEDKLNELKEELKK